MTEEQIRHFETLGFLQLKGLLSPQEVTVLSDAFDAAMCDARDGAPAPQSGEKRQQIIPFFDYDPDTFYPLLDDPRILDVFEALMGEDFIFTLSEGIIHTGGTRWHHDAMAPEGLFSMRAAIYLDRLGPEEGCLNVVPGSHFKEFGAALKASLEDLGIAQEEVPGRFPLVNEPGDVILGMSLDHGGHLSHGTSVNYSGKIYKAFQYGLDEETGDIDYKQVESLAKKHKPKLIIAGFSAFSGIIDWEKFRLIADEVGAYLLVDMAHVAGLVAVNLYPTPVPFADVVTTTTHKTLRGPRGGLILAKHNEEIQKKINSSIIPGSQGGPLMHVIAAKAVCFKEALEPEFKSYQAQILQNANTMCQVFQERGVEIVSKGTKNHMILVDLINKSITGKDAEETLGRANITLNKNAVPNDPQSRFVTSGLRIGTPAVTTRGFKEDEVSLIASWICDILKDLENESEINRVKSEVKNICEKFPVYSFKN